MNIANGRFQSARAHLLALPSAFAIMLLTGWTSANAAPFTLGNLLVTSQAGNVLYEYTRSGVVVQSINVPAPPNSTGHTFLGGVAVEANGRVDVTQYPVTPARYLSVYKASTQTWQHIATSPTPGVFGLADLDVSRLNAKIYADGLQIDPANNYSASSIPSSLYPNGPGGGLSSISVGLDGLLYLVNAGSPQPYVSVVNPSTLSLVRKLTLLDPQGSFLQTEGITAAADGTIFATDAYSWLYRYSSTGKLLSSYYTGVDFPTTLVLDASGTLALSTRSGEVYLANTSFTSHSQFSLPVSQFSYVNFVTAVPEPSSLHLVGLALGFVLALGAARRLPFARRI